MRRKKDDSLVSFFSSTEQTFSVEDDSPSMIISCTLVLLGFAMTSVSNPSAPFSVEAAYNQFEVRLSTTCD